ncbi:hypothetical protein BWD42_23065 [Sphingobacterium sp. CZ-UAM]|nr:hypothetical protein BWD42_23065 [Sphingobacterium sp. CZ-UAM]
MFCAYLNKNKIYTKLLVLLDNNEFYCSYLNAVLPLSTTPVDICFSIHHFLPFFLQKWIKIKFLEGKFLQFLSRFRKKIEKYLSLFSVYI